MLEAGVTRGALARALFARAAAAAALNVEIRQPCQANMPPEIITNIAMETIVAFRDCLRGRAQPTCKEPGCELKSGCPGCGGGPKDESISTCVSIFRPARVSICETIQRASWRLGLSSA